MNHTTKQEILETIRGMKAALGLLEDAVETGELELIGELTCAILAGGEKLEGEFLG